MKEISLSTTRKNEIIDVTARVGEVIANSGVKEGICLVFAPHATAGILILEADGAVEKDANRVAPDCAFRSSRNCVLNSLSNIVPKDARYAHRHGHDSDHGAAHVLSAILGPSKAVPVVGGKLQLGTSPAVAGLCSRLVPTCTWQSIAFCELDGPRSDRKVFVQVVGR